MNDVGFSFCIKCPNFFEGKNVFHSGLKNMKIQTFHVLILVSEGSLNFHIRQDY